MNITSEGVRLVTIGALISGSGWVISMWLRGAGIALALLGVIFTLFCAYFFRDPERNRVFAADEIVCPADGTVMSVREEAEKGVTVVRVFMSVLNVHVQRSPVQGKIESVEFTPGRFAVAYKPEAVMNQRQMFRITAADGRSVGVEQITGAIARRVRAWVRAGDNVAKNQRIGMICFGSQVAVYLPSSVVIAVRPGDSVLSGETILGKWK